MEIEIARNTLVAVIKGELLEEFGLVIEKLPKEQFLVRTRNDDGALIDRKVDKKEIFPIVRDCLPMPLGSFIPNRILEIHGEKVTMSLIRMIFDLRKQVEALRSYAEGVLGVGLKTTQEHLREHESRPH